MKKILILILFPVIFCGRTDGKLTIYSSRGEKFTKPIVEAFEKKTGIQTQFQIGKEAELLLRLEKEGERTMADLFMTLYAGTLEDARQKNLLQGYTSPHSKDIPAAYRGPGDAWTAASARARVVVYNKAKVDPSQIRSLFDIIQPQWKGRLGITVSTNSSFVGGAAALIGMTDADRVRAFLVGLKANAAENVFPKHTPIVNAVARGDLDIGFVNNYYFYRKIAAEPQAPIGILYPDQDTFGSAVTITGVALLKHAKNRQWAEDFIDFVLSEEGQKIYADINYEFPVNPKTKTHPLLPKQGTVKFAAVQRSMQLENLKMAKKWIKEIGMR